MSETSHSLLDRARSQTDAQAWDRLVAVYAPLLRSWLDRYQVQDADAADLVQEVLSVVLRELPAFDHNLRRGAFRTWLKSILVNRLRAYWRGGQYRPVSAGGSDFARQLDELADEESSLSRLWDQQHDEHVMRQLLETVQPKIAPSTWKAFCLQMFDGIGAAEAATTLDISVDSAYAAKSRVLRLLRQEARGLIE